MKTLLQGVIGVGSPTVLNVDASVNLMAEQCFDKDFHDDGHADDDDVGSSFDDLPEPLAHTRFMK